MCVERLGARSSALNGVVAVSATVESLLLFSVWISFFL